MAKRSYVGQLNMYDFFKEPEMNEDGTPKDAEMVSFVPRYREDAVIEPDRTKLEVIDFNLDEELDKKTLEITQASKEIKAATEETIERKRKQEQFDQDAHSILKKADQVISDISAKSRRTDEEIWIEQQMAMRKKHKPKAREIDEQEEFTQESIFSLNSQENVTVAQKKTSEQEKELEPKKQIEITKKSSVKMVAPKKVKDVVIDAEMSEVGSMENPGEPVMERCFETKSGNKIVLAYLNYNKVYEAFPGDMAVTYIFAGSAEAVSYYVDKMHQCQDNSELKELEERPILGPSKLIEVKRNR